MATKEYFYTNDNIADIMDRGVDSGIDWERYGFNVRDISRRQAFTSVGNHMEVLLPIFDKVKFNKELGNLIALGQDEELFYRVLSDEEAQTKKAEFKALKEERKKADNPAQ